MSFKNIIAIEKGFGWFLGSFEDNKMHRHHAVQLSVPLTGKLVLKTKEESLTTSQAVLIRPNIEHALFTTGKHLLVLFNPLEPQGHYWKNLCQAPLAEINHTLITSLKEVASRRLDDYGSSGKLRDLINKEILQYDCYCDDFVHSVDKRIEKSLAYLDLHSDRVVPLEEIANQCSLSPSRFLHLFKATTGQTYRRAQLWTKLNHALPHLGKRPLTSIAHQCGFSDSAHFSRTFTENFGFAPRTLLKSSQFIQV